MHGLAHWLKVAPTRPLWASRQDLLGAQLACTQLATRLQPGCNITHLNVCEVGQVMHGTSLWNC